MSRFNVSTSFKTNKNKVFGVSRQAQKLAATEISLAIKAEAERLLNLKVYPPASTPGQSPARRTGTLAGSIIRQVVKTKVGYNVSVGVAKRVPYGTWLEVGTTKMKKRPFLRPAYDRTLKKANLIIVQALQRELRKAR